MRAKPFTAERPQARGSSPSPLVGSDGAVEQQAEAGHDDAGGDDVDGLPPEGAALGHGHCGDRDGEPAEGLEERRVHAELAGEPDDRPVGDDTDEEAEPGQRDLAPYDLAL